uniref:HTH_Tnp_Tc3_2 domain-containing protein n=1 Tax=Heterorhabditis bacteriophora TaxID=37862 RepID=A0A1I7XEP6_HETBA
MKIEDWCFRSIIGPTYVTATRRPGGQLGSGQATVSRRLHKMGKIRKFGKRVPHELFEDSIGRQLNPCIPLIARQRKKNFLWKTVSGEGKYIMHDNPKHTYIMGRPRTANKISGQKVLLCICWDMKAVLFCKLLQPHKTVALERRSRQWTHLLEGM